MRQFETVAMLVMGYITKDEWEKTIIGKLFYARMCMICNVEISNTRHVIKYLQYHSADNIHDTNFWCLTASNCALLQVICGSTQLCAASILRHSLSKSLGVTPKATGIHRTKVQEKTGRASHVPVFEKFVRLGPELTSLPAIPHDTGKLLPLGRAIRSCVHPAVPLARWVFRNQLR